VAPHFDITGIRLSAVDGLFLKATIGTRGPVLPESDSAIIGTSYRICLNTTKPVDACSGSSSADVVWTVVGATMRGARGAPRTPRYTPSAAGLQPDVVVKGTSIAVQGMLPAEDRDAKEIFVSASAESSRAPGSSAGQGPPAMSGRATTTVADQT